MTRSAQTGNKALLAVAAIFILPFGAHAASDPPRSEPLLEFKRDIEPIFQSHCVRCHGADKRKGGLLLTSRKDALIPADSGKAVFVPGDSKKSELIRRLETADAEERMPPSGPPLSAGEIARLRKWIDDGMSWADQAKSAHWAYVKPVRPPLPAVSNEAWCKNPIDRFILARLDKERLTPSAAERERLIRRVYLDLIGLPPSVEQVDAFVKDTRADAYERVVDELLASPHYGERWSRHWLDLARYADSNGFQRDGFRTVWPYRDWVVAALNRDLPFDQFALEQIAGDLLPQATAQQRVATGFNRCTTVNVEAGTDREENRVNAVFDRVNTTATVFLGTSLACAQCHNHKYDPFSQNDYYRLFAYFNSTQNETAEGDKTAREFIGPKMMLPMTPEKQARVEELQKQREPLSRDLKTRLDAAAPQQAAWEKQCLANKEQLLKLPADIRKALNQPKRTRKQLQDLSDYFADLQPELKKLRMALASVEEEIRSLEPTTTLVMAEMSRPRPTHIFKRGNFLDKGQPVQPGVPAALHSMPKGATAPAKDNDKTEPAAPARDNKKTEPAAPARDNKKTEPAAPARDNKKTEPAAPARDNKKTEPAAPARDNKKTEPAAPARDNNRLALAKWLIDDDNPLIARVTVNRWWAEFFGQGLVATLEDFGSQGDRPTHPELLDWLAVEFMTPSPQAKASRWSMKHVHRLIVTSAAYRQSSRVSAELVKRDPDNKLYARGPRFRLDAEMIRDNALAVGGLLSLKMGGPPVMPPQPAGIWTVTGVVDNTYRTSSGEDRYRRGLYTIWRRSSPYPSFVAFDAPDRASCIVKRTRTNTPLQALTLLNDPVYVEAALALGRRMASLELPGRTSPAGNEASAVSERIIHGFRLCLARQPSAREVQLLQAVHDQGLTKYRANPAAARALMQNAPAGANLDPVQWGAWFQVATVLLNLDEMITKS